MKKLCLVAVGMLMASLASAATITWTCPTTGALQGLSGQSASNSSTVTCTTLDPAAPGSGVTFTNIQMNYSLDFTFNTFDPGAKSTTWALDVLGVGLDLSGLVVDNSGGANQRPRVGSVSSVVAGDLAAYSGLGNGNLVLPAGAISYVGASSAITAGTADLQFVLTYIVDEGGVPEPTTMLMFGAGLLALGLARRKQ